MNWWQNTRLPYWTMFAPGDFEQLEVVFRYYLNMVEFANGRTQIYFNHTGIFFTETKQLFGAFGAGHGDTSKGWPVWLETNDYVHLDYGGNAGGTEVSLMILDAYLYTQNATLLKTYLPIVSLTVDFFRQHYHNRTADNKYVIWPTQALETYWCAGWDVSTTPSRPPANCCVDDMPTVAALYALTERLLQLPMEFSTPEQRGDWKTFHSQLPKIPLTADGKSLAAAGNISEGIHNGETPELYSGA